MSEEIKEVHIKTYDEWLKYYENATKEQVVEDLTQDVKYFADAVKDIKELQNQLQQKDKEIERLNSIINELEESLKDDKEEYKKDLDIETKELYNEYWRGYSICAEKNLEYLQELKGSEKE